MKQERIVFLLKLAVVTAVVLMVSAPGFAQLGLWDQGIYASIESRRSSLLAQDNDLDQELARLRDYVNSILEDSKVPGLAMGIVKDGAVIFAEGFGYRDREKRLPVTARTLFAIGSCSKAFTTMAIGMLVDEGVVEWDKPVRTYLPGFQLKDAYITGHMTVRDLVTHRSGLPRHDALWYGSPFTREEMFNRLKYLDFSAGFREKFQYNNLMFMTAGYLVGQVTNGTWEQFVERHIFEPLGMMNSNFSVDVSGTTSDFAQPYSLEDENVEKIPFRNIDEIGPAGSINSCVDDMVKWIQFHINSGKVGEEQLISESEIRAMHTPHMQLSSPMSSNEQSHTSYGLGWMISMYRGHKLVQHSGGIDGFGALTSFMPFDSVGVFVVNNAASPISSMAAMYAYDLILELEPIDRYAEMKEAQKKAEEAEQEEKEERIEGTSPSHSLEEYAGTYEHPGYGGITIVFDGDSLTVKFNSFEFKLRHWHYDVFKSTGNIALSDALVSFITGVNGGIDRITVPLEPTVDPIEFTRVPSEALSSAAYLEKFVGEYEISSMTITVELRGGSTLVATPTGQPTFELVPYKENKFNLRNLQGYSAEFTVRDGKAVEMILYQPNGVFTAKRVK